MNVSYTAPLARAWERMQRLLFRPFQLEVWLTVGFSAFLANIFSGGGSGGGGRYSFSRNATSPADVDVAVRKVTEFFSNPVWLGLIAGALIVFAIVIAILLWLSARANFVFLENVVTGRAAFREPWSRHAKLGHSLFLWWALLSFAWLVPLGFLAIPVTDFIRLYATRHVFAMPGAGGLLVGGSGFLLSALLIAAVSALTNSFVVPLMYRYRENATDAWRRFWPLLTGNVGDFIAYLVFALVLMIGVVIAVLIAGLATCCIGLILLAIPYVGTVILLPIEVTWRAFGPEFLAQYGPQWNAFEGAASPETAGPGQGDPIVTG